jgi:hypothetical protein
MSHGARCLKVARQAQYVLLHYSVRTKTMQKLAIAAAVLMALTATACADGLIVYGAGSLRKASDKPRRIRTFILFF